jgi:hypothetical protein
LAPAFNKIGRRASWPLGRGERGEYRQNTAAATEKKRRRNNSKKTY